MRSSGRWQSLTIRDLYCESQVKDPDNICVHSGFAKTHDSGLILRIVS